MKKSLLTFIVLNLVTIAFTQSFVSNEISNNEARYERIDLYDDEENVVASVSPKFYKHKSLKKRVKPIKVDGKTLFIIKGKSGTQSVCTEAGDHVALMNRHERTIQMVGDLQKYTFHPTVKFSNFNVLECKDGEGTLVSTTAFNGDRKLSYEHNGEQTSSSLLMALCIHQYQELLLGERGILSALNVIHAISNGLCLF